MKANLKVSPVLTIEFDVPDQKSLFEEVASYQEIFQKRVCGLCQSENVICNVRTATKGKQIFTYYEVKCQNCSGHFQFGVRQEGGKLFPKYSNQNGGWSKYVPQNDE